MKKKKKKAREKYLNILADFVSLNSSKHTEKGRVQGTFDRMLAATATALISETVTTVLRRLRGKGMVGKKRHPKTTLFFNVLY